MTQAWRRLSLFEDIEIPKLVFAGHMGEFSDDFQALMKSTAGLGGFVEVIDGPPDVELDYLYQKCEFTIMASMYEGWDLPIGESLSYGKTAVVGDASSLPEVGGDLVEYCDVNSITRIAKSCEKLVRDVDYKNVLEERIAAASLRSRGDVAQDLILIVNKS
jgi:glycosyltransferase involved in cell wall biosynthesis